MLYINLSMTNITTDSVRTYLGQRITEKPTYLKAHDIAADLDTSPKAVAQYLHQPQDEFTGITLLR